MLEVFVAILRVIALSSQTTLLLNNNQYRLFVFEICACVSSFYIIYYRFCFKCSQKQYVPSCKVLDMCATVLVAFLNTPLYNSKSDFDSIARFLVSVILLFSSFSTLFLAQIHFYKINKWLCLCWFVQVLATSVLVAETVVIPFSFDMLLLVHRNQALYRMSIFCGIVWLPLSSINFASIQIVNNFKRSKAAPVAISAPAAFTVSTLTQK